MTENPKSDPADLDAVIENAAHEMYLRGQHPWRWEVPAERARLISLATIALDVAGVAALVEEVERLDTAIDAAAEWGRSVAEEINVLPLFRALGLMPQLGKSAAALEHHASD
jgi:hypothetical protein